VSETTIDSDSNEPTLIERLEQVCDEFESHWRSGRRVRIEDFLVQVPAAARPAVFRDLLSLELTYRRLAGESPSAAEYSARFSEHEALVEAAFSAPLEQPEGPSAGFLRSGPSLYPALSNPPALRHRRTG
jgi:hypothetical protein